MHVLKQSGSSFSAQLWSLILGWSKKTVVWILEKTSAEFSWLPAVGRPAENSKQYVAFWTFTSRDVVNLFNSTKVKPAQCSMLGYEKYYKKCELSILNFPWGYIIFFLQMVAVAILLGWNKTVWPRGRKSVSKKELCPQQVESLGALPNAAQRQACWSYCLLWWYVPLTWLLLHCSVSGERGKGGTHVHQLHWLSKGKNDLKDSVHILIYVYRIDAYVAHYSNLWDVEEDMFVFPASSCGDMWKPPGVVVIPNNLSAVLERQGSSCCKYSTHVVLAAQPVLSWTSSRLIEQ